MTEEDQRIALCEWMGWKYHKPTPEEIASGSYYQYEPDTNSLDVLHQMEMKLSRDQFENYLESFKEVLRLEPFFKVESLRSIISATASQRREALLKTLGLWRD